MSHRGWKIWAVSATAALLFVIGLQVGRHLGEPVRPNTDLESPGPNQAFAQTEPAPGPGNGRQATKPYAIPGKFSEVPSEWRTLSVDGQFDGFVALFDPQQRRMIVEQCRHRGYFNLDDDQPITIDWEFCEPVFWGTIQSLDEYSAAVIGRDRSLIDVSLDLSEEGSSQSLTMTFDESEVTLMPGSKNDLFQEMERRPVIAEQRRRLFELEQQKITEARAADRTDP